MSNKPQIVVSPMLTIAVICGLDVEENRLVVLVIVNVRFALTPAHVYVPSHC